MKKNGQIISYTNPDMDSVFSSIAYSKYLQKKGRNFDVVIDGIISDDIMYVLKLVNINLPNNKFTKDAKLILIDTHSISQISHNLCPQNVIEILDHHPIGDDDMFSNAIIKNENIGAVATLIAETIFADSLMDFELAVLLGSAIISNTIDFTAPSTSLRDLQIFEKLKEYFSFSDNFIKTIMELRFNKADKSTKEMLESDLKIFKINDYKVGISQLEIYDANEFTNRDDLLSTLELYMEQNEYNYFFLNVIDTKNRASTIVVSNNETKKILEKILNVTIDLNKITINKILLRKTDFIPQIKILLETDRRYNSEK